MRFVSIENRAGHYGPVLSERADPPEPTGADVLVRVAASSINGSDIGLRRSGGLARIITQRASPGFDIAGVVARCGPQVSSFDVGDRVMGLLGHRGGGFAEFVTVHQNRLAVVPDALSDVTAAALPLAGLTALQALRRRGRLQSGTDARVLINGAAGGIGSFAIQIAKFLGAHVTAVAGGDREAFVRELGADDVIDRSRFHPASADGVFDVILDVPGILRYSDARGALAPAGALVSTRPITTDRIRVPLPYRSGARQRAVAVATSPSPQDLGFLSRLVRDGHLTSPVDRVFPLDEVADAFRHAESGRLRGKVVLTI